MLFGESTPADEAERLLSQAADAGINFFDTAEMYPVPQRAETQVGRCCLFCCLNMQRVKDWKPLSYW